MDINIETKDFFKAILSLKDEKECENFFSDVCTEKEVITLAQRFLVAQMIQRKQPYTEIVNSTGASTATISRVNRVIKHGNGMLEELVERVK